MYCTIKHESTYRLRIHLKQCYMTLAEADQVQYWMQSLKGIDQVKVNDRTADAIIRYDGSKDTRQQIIDRLSAFDYATCVPDIPDHTGREMQRYYEDKMFNHVMARVITRWFLPIPVRNVIAVVKAIPLIWKGIKSLAKGNLDVHVLDATSVSFALLRSDFNTAGSVMFLLGIGDIMEEWTHRKSVDDLANAMSLHVDKVWVKQEDGSDLLVPIYEVKPDDKIVVRTGNMIPLDGFVDSGDAMVNQASITGEPLSVHKTETTPVFAGTVVEEGQLVIKVSKGSGAGQYDRIVQMIEESEKLKSDTETRVSSLADHLVPVTFIATALTYLFTRNATRAYSIMMVDFCCALKLSMPISFLSAMHDASINGISVKGGKVMEDYAQATTIVFDKTGTLTKAEPKVKEVVPFGGNDPVEMLKLAACLEEHYPHSIANAVVKKSDELHLHHAEEHSEVKYIVAHGIASDINGVLLRIGSHHFIFEDEGVTIPEGEQEKFDSLPDEYSHLYLSVGGQLAAVILIEDPIKDEAKQAIKSLHEVGFENVVMLTGDSERTAKAVANRLGIDTYCSEVLPEDKAAFIEKEHKLGHKVIMVGDGINDTPALSAADIGVAITSGAAIAREIADITISENDLMALVTLRQLCDALYKRNQSTYRFIMNFNSALIVLGMFGILQPSMTALAHNASTIAISMHCSQSLLPKKIDYKKQPELLAA